MLDSALWKTVDGADKENHSGIKQDQWVSRFSNWPSEKSLHSLLNEKVCIYGWNVPSDQTWDKDDYQAESCSCLEYKLQGSGVVFIFIIYHFSHYVTLNNYWVKMRNKFSSVVEEKFIRGLLNEDFT